MVSVILDNLAAGSPARDIAQEYGIADEDVQAAISYAAELASDRMIPFPADVA